MDSYAKMMDKKTIDDKIDNNIHSWMKILIKSIQTMRQSTDEYLPGLISFWFVLFS